MVAELTALRDQIDEVDKALLDLLARRPELVAEVGEVKAVLGCRFTCRNGKPLCLPLAGQKRKPLACRRT